MYDNIIQNEDLQLAAQKKFNKAEGFKERFIACQNKYSLPARQFRLLKST